MQELQKKEEEMRQMFVVRVKEKEGELKEAEKEVYPGRREMRGRDYQCYFEIHIHVQYNELDGLWKLISNGVKMCIIFALN